MIGQLAADLMDNVPEEANGAITSVGMVVVVDEGEEVYTRIKCWPDSELAQLRVFADALLTVRMGEGVE